MPNKEYELSLNEHLMLILEQGKIERISLLNEIKSLRKRLSSHGINDNDIASWIVSSDEVMDKLLRYELGCAGKLTKNNQLRMPYTYRRKTRKKLS